MEWIGRADPRFNLPGGGSVNIYLYHALARLPEPLRAGARLVFTAHSVPLASAVRSRYREQLAESARLVAARRLPVRAAEHDQPVQRLELPAAGDELAREPIEQCGVRRVVAEQAEIVR